VALIGFFAIGGALGVTVGGAGLGVGAIGLWGATSGNTPRWF